MNGEYKGQLSPADILLFIAEAHMKRKITFLIVLTLIPTLALQGALVGCAGRSAAETTDALPGEDQSSEPAGDEAGEKPSDAATEADVVLFIGQSNMAGRGVARQAIKVAEGHAYEFRAISDPTKLYPLTEPFGADENNNESGVSEDKKTGSMASAFCESYYSVTGRPIVAVSCSKGGERISFFDTKTKVYADAVARVKSAQDFLADKYESGESDLKPGKTYIVWLQGESDGDVGTPANNYTKTLTRIVNGFKKDVGADQFFVIPIGRYNGNDSARNDRYTAIRQAQIDFCIDNESASVISIQAQDLQAAGLMKDEFHFKQEGYEILGADAGANMGFFVTRGEKPDCKPYAG